MKPGPPKTPTAIRLLRGNPGKEKLNTNEPKPADGRPAVPPALSPAASLIWTETITLLAGVPGLLTVADGATVELFARTLARYRELEAFVEEHGSTVVLRDDKGDVRSVQTCPQAALAAKLLPQLRGLAAELGLNPSARARISLPATIPHDELTQFLSRSK